MEIDALQSKPVQKLMDAIKQEHGVCGNLFLDDVMMDPISGLYNYYTFDKIIIIRASGAGGMPPKRGGNVKPTIVKQKTSDQEDNTRAKASMTATCSRRRSIATVCRTTGGTSPTTPRLS